MPWRMITDQANAAAESNGRFFLTKRIDSPKTNQRIDSNCELECSKPYSKTTIIGINGLETSTGKLSRKYRAVVGHASAVSDSSGDLRCYSPHQSLLPIHAAVEPSRFHVLMSSWASPLKDLLLTDLLLSLSSHELHAVLNTMHYALPWVGCAPLYARLCR